jgi:phosphate starvation-inducible protein PhoH and related proteins
MSQKPSKLRIEHLITLEPLTKSQENVFASWKDGFNLVLSGSAGTGKTYISTYLSLLDIMDKNKPEQKLVIVRSAVPTRDMGFLPGTLEEKEDAYKAPYYSILTDLFEDKDAWRKIEIAKQIEFLTTSFIRGITLTDCVVLIDESQNLTYHELCSVITRLGNNCRIILCGDYYQSDFTKSGDRDGLERFTKILENMKLFDHIEFTWEDIVRSGLVRDFIMTKELVENGKL